MTLSTNSPVLPFRQFLAYFHTITSYTILLNALSIYAYMLSCIFAFVNRKKEIFAFFAALNMQYSCGIIYLLFSSEVHFMDKKIAVLTGERQA